MNSLKKNYGLSLWLTRLAFVACNVFSKWLHITSIAAALGEQSGWEPEIYDSFWFALLLGAVFAVVTLLIFTWFVRWFLRFSRLHNLPASEIVLFAVLFAALKNLISGLMKLTYLITPVIIGWGQLLFDFVALIAAVIAFYHFISKRYLSEGNRAPFFNLIFSATSIYSVAILILGVYTLL